MHIDHCENTELIENGHMVVKVTFVGHVDVVKKKVYGVNEIAYQKLR